MDKVDMYLMTNKKYFPASKMIYLRERLENIDDSKFVLLSSVDFK